MTGIKEKLLNLYTSSLVVLLLKARKSVKGLQERKQNLLTLKLQQGTPAVKYNKVW